jgi:hypothetical protein
MRIKPIIGIVAAGLLVVGCASPRGGTSDMYDYETISGSDVTYQEDGTGVDLDADNWPMDDIFPTVTRYEQNVPGRMRFPEMPSMVR